jgi:hypothetical protein
VIKLRKLDCTVCQIGIFGFDSFKTKSRNELNLKI